MKYVEFIPVSVPKNIRTKRFNVLNVTGTKVLSAGYIYWRGPLRRYVFGTSNCTELDQKCLKQITDFIEELMNVRKKNN
jgi:hypothetical protein